MPMNNRIIGEHIGENKGPLLIVFGAMHGNEPAGVKALEMVFKMLEVEPITNPTFSFSGKLLGLIGNLKAYHQNSRFIDKDLNRSWKEQLIAAPYSQLAEQQELKEILDIIHAEIEAYQPTELIVLDLHTTSSFGGIFSIVTSDPRSLEIAKAFHAPVILGFLEILEGTTLHYFTSENFNISTTALTFESGQHEEELSINRAIAAIVNCLKASGMVDATHIENQHDRILIDYSKNLPSVVRLIESYQIGDNEQFIMRPGYQNFQQVKAGEILADNEKGQVKCEHDALILMPLYQKQGDDGYFLVSESI